MTKDSFSISPATADDTDAIVSFLSSVGLPIDGVAEHVNDFLLARDDNNELIGCAGLERYGEFGLLRSVAVSPTARHAGVGSCLTARVIETAKQTGVHEVLLLTDTAHDFFAKCFNFKDTKREDYNDEFDRSPEWNLPRCASAAVMKLELEND